MPLQDLRHAPTPLPPDGGAIPCPLCHRTSDNAHDVAERFCRACGVFAESHAAQWFVALEPGSQAVLRQVVAVFAPPLDVPPERLLARLIGELWLLRLKAQAARQRMTWRMPRAEVSHDAG